MSTRVSSAGIVGDSPHAARPLAPDVRSFTYATENEPNPDVLLNSIRKAGYTLESAIGDLVDNPLDHDAEVISVSIHKVDDDWDVRVADNGTGMDWETLKEMLRLGSRSPHDPSRDLGFYGVGSTTASLSLGRHLHVVTRSADGRMLSGATDLDVIRDTRKFVKHMDVASDEEISLFEQTFARDGLPIPETGTVVRVTHCDLFPYRDERRALKEVNEYVAETYRYFIEAGRRFVVTTPHP